MPNNIQQQRADQIYRTGPETLIAESSAVVAGPATDYSRRVISMSQPESDGFPLKWIADGQIRQPQVLKGQPKLTVFRFSRPEQSLFIMEDSSDLYWEEIYGELRSGEQAVLFIDGETEKSILKVVPSGKGEQDLIALVKDIVKIQALQQADDQTENWLQYLRSSSSDEGRKAALRSLVNTSVEWAKLAPELNRLLTNLKNSADIRAFSFGIAAFGVIEEKWVNHHQTVDFLCRRFLAENDAELTMQYLQHLKLILHYSNDESFRKTRQSLRQQVLDCLKRREAAGRLDTQLAAQFKQIWALYNEE